MNINSIQASQASSLAAYGKTGRPPGPPPPAPPQGPQEDSMTISAEAMSQYLSGVSDSVKTATSDLQGSQSNLMEDLQTIGEYFRTHGGRQGLDAYMEANFSQAELTKFKEVTGQGPGGAPR